MASCHQKLGEAWTRFSLSLQKEPTRLPTLSSDFWPPEPRDNKFLLL